MILSQTFLTQALPSSSFYKGTDRGILEVDNNISSPHEVNLSIDSRTLAPGDLFIALKGTNVDGHDFIQQAFAMGACGAIISDKEKLSKIPQKLLAQKIVIQVPDVLQALIALAQTWRSKLTIPVIGITGSVGKTTTKEMTRHIFRKAGFNVFGSFKNQNTALGLCINLLNVRTDHEVAIFEVGINEQGEMDQLADILRPTLALITCIAHAHGQGLGTVQDIFSEKRKLFKHLSMSEVGIICGDQDMCVRASYTHPIAKFGLKTKNQVQARKIHFIHDEQGRLSTAFVLKWYGQKRAVTLQGNHRGFVMNALAASTIAYLHKISLDVVIDALQTYQGIEKRFEFKTIAKNRGQLISDCYNANPESMKAALVAFNQMEIQGKKIAVLGDMLELGSKELYWHRQIGRLLRKMPSIDQLILVGERARQIAETAPSAMKVALAQDWQEAANLLDQSLLGNQNLVLVKASLGMKLGNMIETFVE